MVHLRVVQFRRERAVFPVRELVEDDKNHLLFHAPHLLAHRVYTGNGG